ncbi:uncharacterized protein [Ptychodera flava]|uniref:uncharacterized protein n=1 Tax=Ptychodera flava TaxID=63121 RepID=UPI003969E1BF
MIKAIIKTVRTRKLEIKVQEQAFDEYQLSHLRMLLLSGRRLQEMAVIEDTDESIGRFRRLKRILRLFYRSRPGFKYSTRLISTMVVSFFAVYMVFLMLIYLSRERGEHLLERFGLSSKINTHS